jgi:hypothetical protein
MRHDTPNPSGCKLGHSHARQRMQLGAQRLHRLGERAVYEFLAELAEDTDTAPIILGKLEVWATLDPDILVTVLHRFCSGRDFPPQLIAVPA